MKKWVRGLVAALVVVSAQAASAVSWGQQEDGSFWFGDFYRDRFLDFQAAAVKRGYVYPTIHGDSIDYAGRVAIGGRLYPAGTTVLGDRLDYAGRIAIGGRLYPAGTTVVGNRIDYAGSVVIGGATYRAGTTVVGDRIDASGGIVLGGQVVYPRRR